MHVAAANSKSQTGQMLLGRGVRVASRGCRGGDRQPGSPSCEDLEQLGLFEQLLLLPLFAAWEHGLGHPEVLVELAVLEPLPTLRQVAKAAQRTRG